MNHAKLSEGYKTFFESPEGEAFIKELDRQLEAAHREAEDNPELARDYVQRAKGVRGVLDHIKIVMTDAKKGKPM